MKNESPRKMSSQSREERWPDFSRFSDLSGASSSLKEFYRQKRILRILKIRSEKTRSPWATSKSKGGLRVGFWGYFFGVLMIPGFLANIFSPVSKLLPGPIQYFVNGILVFVGIEILDALLLARFRKPEFAEKAKELTGKSASELIEIEDKLFQEFENESRYASSWIAGKLVLFFTGLMGWGLTLLVLIQLDVFKKLAGNPLSILVYVGSMLVGVGLAQWFWNSISHWGRFGVRTLLHYWPLALYVVVGVVLVLKRTHSPH